MSFNFKKPHSSYIKLASYTCTHTCENIIENLYHVNFAINIITSTKFYKQHYYHH